MTTDVINVPRELLERAVNLISAGPSPELSSAKSLISQAIALLATAQPAADKLDEPSDSFIQPVPDKCDRIIWRGHYYHLPDMQHPAADGEREIAYDRIDRYLRNNLDDDDYAEFSASLDKIAAQPAKAEGVAVPEGYALVPVEPTEAQWSGLARHIMMWLDMGKPTVKALRQHLDMLGVDIPAWLEAESEMKGEGVPSKGTRVAIIYRAMIEDYLAAAPVPPVLAE